MFDFSLELNKKTYFRSVPAMTTGDPKWFKNLWYEVVIASMGGQRKIGDGKSNLDFYPTFSITKKLTSGRELPLGYIEKYLKLESF